MTAHTDTDDRAATSERHDNGTKNKEASGELHPKEVARREAVAEFPYLALTVQTSGIHPSTARLVAVDAVTFNDAGETSETFHAVLNPGEDPGPRHYHGLSREEVDNGQRFAKILKPLDRLIDDRTLIVHDLPLTWGFLVSEAKRAMSAAARANRKRSRKGNRKRQRVGHIPQPARIVDTLATARRQEISFSDIRPAGVARASGLSAVSPVASVVRAGRSQEETSRETTQLVWDIYQHQQRAAEKSLITDHELIAGYHPGDLRADRFGLQRSHVRVQAAEAELSLANPGKYVPGRSLIEGMEVVVADEIGYSPDTIIDALLEAGLVYREHLHRGVSVVVCNKTTDLRGKAMHAVRKGIPLLGDTAFLDALTRVKPHPDPDAPVDQSTHPRGVLGGSSGLKSSSKPGKKSALKSATKSTNKPGAKTSGKSGAKPGKHPGKPTGAQSGAQTNAKSGAQPNAKSGRPNKSNKRRRSRSRRASAQPQAD